ncbi:MAG: DUF2911 domain-containing protein [Candidatus Eisenbacteria bacterium]
MKPFGPLLAPLVALTLATPAIAKEGGNFVVRLGQDTVGVERYVRTPDRLEIDQVGRAPRVLRRHFVYEYAKGAMTHLSLAVTAPGAATPTQTIDATMVGDSLRTEIRNAGGPPQVSSVALPPGTLVVTGSSPWAGYEARLMEFVAGKRDSLRGTMYFLGAPGPDWLSLHRLGRDSVVIFNGHQDLFHVRVDKDGRILTAVPIAGTQKFTVDRVEKLDVDAMAASYAAREQSGAGIGMLSPRDTVNVHGAGGATLWIDYGRPAKRGRVVFGTVVPFGEVWRTGANAATQFRTDKNLMFGSTTVPAGFYTLWSIPSPDGWKLIVNSETGQWGTAHKASMDLYTIDMKTSTLPQVVERFTITVEPSAQGGVLNLDWDTTRASVPFTVQP